jgi:ficolin
MNNNPSTSERRAFWALINIVILLWITTLVNSIAVTNKRDCAEIQSILPGYQFSYGPYQILAGEARRPVNVYCCMNTDGGGWTVIQRRANNSIAFNRNWAEYVEGFGDPLGNFWIGNSYLHSILTQKRYVLRVDLWDWDGNFRYAEYDDFFIGGQACKYKLMKIGDYCGDAGDSLRVHVGMKFSTQDQDNDNSPDSCAIKFKGAWWYNNCHDSNLNGDYKPTGVMTTDADGIIWQSWKGYYYSMKRVEMKIRPYDY